MAGASSVVLTAVVEGVSPLATFDAQLEATGEVLTGLTARPMPGSEGTRSLVQVPVRLAPVPANPVTLSTTVEGVTRRERILLQNTHLFRADRPLAGTGLTLQAQAFALIEQYLEHAVSGGTLYPDQDLYQYSLNVSQFLEPGYVEEQANYYKILLWSLAWRVEDVTLKVVKQTPKAPFATAEEESLLSWAAGTYRLVVDLEGFYLRVRLDEYECQGDPRASWWEDMYDDYECYYLGENDDDAVRLDEFWVDVLVERPTLEVELALQAPWQELELSSLSGLDLAPVDLEEDPARTLAARTGDLAAVVLDVDFYLRRADGSKAVTTADYDELIMARGEYYQPLIELGIESFLVQLMEQFTTLLDGNDERLEGGLLPTLRDGSLVVDLNEVYGTDQDALRIDVAESLYKAIAPMYQQKLPDEAEVPTQTLQAHEEDFSSNLYEKLCWTHYVETSYNEVESIETCSQLAMIYHETDALEYLVNASLYHARAEPPAAFELSFTNCKTPQPPLSLWADLFQHLEPSRVLTAADSRLHTGLDLGEPQGFVAGRSYDPAYGQASLLPFDGATDSPVVAGLTDSSLNQLLFWFQDSGVFSYPCEDSLEDFEDEANETLCRYRIRNRVAPAFNLADAEVSESRAALPSEWYNLELSLECSEGDSLVQAAYRVDGRVWLELQRGGADTVETVRDYISCDTNDLLVGALAAVTVEEESVRFVRTETKGAQSALEQRMDDLYVGQALDLALRALLKEMACEEGADRYMAPVDATIYPERASFCASTALPSRYLMFYRVDVCDYPYLRGAYLADPLGVVEERQVDLGVHYESDLCVAEPLPGTGDRCVGMDWCVPDEEVCDGVSCGRFPDGCGGSVECGCVPGESCVRGLCEPAEGGSGTGERLPVWLEQVRPVREWVRGAMWP